MIPAQPNSNCTIIKTLSAVAGSQKTRTLAKDATDNLDTQRSVFAVRTIKNAELLEETIQTFINPDYSPAHQMNDARILRIDSETSPLVKVDLEIALKDKRKRIVIITHRTLIDFESWSLYADDMVLNIDEIPDAIELSTSTLADKQLGALGFSVDDFDLLRESPALLKEGAIALNGEESRDTPYNANASKLWRVLEGAADNCIELNLVNAIASDDTARIRITAIKQSSLFDRIKCFGEVRIAAMSIKDTLFELLAVANGMSFTNYEWGNSGKQFVNDDKINIYVLNGSGNLLSKRQLESMVSDEVNVFETMINQILKIPAFRDSPEEILIYMNKDSGARKRSSALTKMNVKSRFEEMPYNCHGFHKWQDQSRTLFAMLLTFRWNPLYNKVGKAFADNLGVTFEELQYSYVVSNMFEPTAQAATRGVIRHDSANSPDTHIAVPDIVMAEWLRDNIFPKANIENSYAITLANKPTGRPVTTWRGVALQDICGNEADAKWIHRHIEKISSYYGKQLDHTNPIDVVLVIHYLNKYAPSRTLYKTEMWDSGCPIQLAA